MPTVSVVTPTYNRADVLPRAIDSILNQTFADFELIVVDDGSTDNTEKVVKSYADNRIQYIQFENNRGANAARTQGIKSASGKYIGFLDSDDEWLPRKIEKQVKTIQSSGSDIAYTGIKQVDSDGNLITTTSSTISGDVTDDLLRGNFIGTYSAVMVSQDVVREAGYPDPDLSCWQDWEWYLRLSDHGQFVSINQPLVVRHNGGNQISNNFQYRIESFDCMIDALHQRASDESQIKESEACLNFRVGYSALSNHVYSVARSRFVQSIKLNPTKKKYYIYLLSSSIAYPVLREFKRTLERYVEVYND